MSGLHRIPCDHPACSAWFSRADGMPALIPPGWIYESVGEQFAMAGAIATNVVVRVRCPDHAVTDGEMGENPPG